jgi:hypothetical protein
MLTDELIEITEIELPVAILARAHDRKRPTLDELAEAPIAHPEILRSLAGSKQSAFGLATVGRKFHQNELTSEAARFSGLDDSGAFEVLGTNRHHKQHHH